MELRRCDCLGRYEVEECLGRGGMGEVFRAWDPKLQRRVAIKLLRASAERSPGGAGMLDEARAAAALRIAGIVGIHDIDEVDGCPFIVMEYVDGRSLRALIDASQGSLPTRLRWLRDTARALGVAHEAGLVHLDIKPENVMLRNDGVIKLLDFGVARRLEADDHSPRERAGTPLYMAPEQVRRERVDGRADQFAWGVMAWELLTGESPWRGSGLPPELATVTQHLPSLSTLAPSLPRSVTSIVERTLEKRAADRFESMAVVASALDRALSVWGAANEPPPSIDARAQATASTVIDPPRQLGEHRPRRLPTTVLLLALMVVTGGGALFGRERAPTIDSTAESPEPAVTWQPNPAAAAAYADGQESLLGARVSAAIAAFALAVEYEPKFAAAHLRLALARFVDGPYPIDSEPYYAASRLRAHLDAHDQALLDAFEPAIGREPPELDELERRLTRLGQRWPDDRELALYQAVALSLTGHIEDARERFRWLASGNDPRASGWLGLAYLDGEDDELDHALTALDACLELTPDSIDCLWFRSKIHAHLGACEAMEADAYAWLELDEDDEDAAITRTHALVARGASSSRIEAAQAEEAEHMDLATHAISSHFTDAARAILVGDFAVAERLLEELPELTRLRPHEWVRLYELRVALREEVGDVAGAAELARELLARKGMLPGGGYDSDEEIVNDPTVWLARVRLAAGEIDRAQFVAVRDAWIATWQARGAVDNERELWLRGHAEPSRTVGEAREALEVLGDELSRWFVTDRLLIVHAARVHLLAGVPERARAMSEAATSSCLAPVQPLHWVWAHALLGQAREALGDIEGACAAYQVVEDRWGHAPGSLTAALATSRLKVLRCAPVGPRW